MRLMFPMNLLEYSLRLHLHQNLAIIHFYFRHFSYFESSKYAVIVLNEFAPILFKTPLASKFSDNPF